MFTILRDQSAPRGIQVLRVHKDGVDTLAVVNFVSHPELPDYSVRGYRNEPCDYVDKLGDVRGGQIGAVDDIFDGDDLPECVAALAGSLGLAAPRSTPAYDPTDPEQDLAAIIAAELNAL